MNKREALRNLPAVHRVLNHAACAPLLGAYPHQVVAMAIGDEIDRLRVASTHYENHDIDDGVWLNQVSPESILTNVGQRLKQRFTPSLRNVLNLTGVIVHTNLGRAPLSKRSVEAVCMAASSYSNLEFNLLDGKRGSRHGHVEERICRLTGAEAALVVNNNAAAVLLVFHEMAKGGEAIVSRGQLVEIGGSFRIPDVMEASGVTLVEVGTTNKTKLADYQRAMNENTKLVVRVHTSNYRIVGFTEETPLNELVNLAHANDFPVYEDLGSGALFDFEAVGIGDEKTVRRSIDAEVDVVSFSGDKLLGGPQAGIVVGRKAWIDRMKKNPLVRALRPDKMTLAALEATLIEYELEQQKYRIPVVRMLTESEEALQARGSQIFERLQVEKVSFAPLTFCLVVDDARVGGGALPLTSLATTGMAVSAEGCQPDHLLLLMRTVPNVPIVGRIVNDKVVLNFRTLMLDEESTFIESLEQCAAFLRRIVC